MQTAKLVYLKKKTPDFNIDVDNLAEVSSVKAINKLKFYLLLDRILSKIEYMVLMQPKLKKKSSDKHKGCFLSMFSYVSSLSLS